MKITVDVIPHKNQRYNTVGDWQFDGFGNLKVNISQLGNEDSEFLIAIHEIVEAYLCKKAGISEQVVDAWDLNYKGEGEPGDAENCPYGDHHYMASVIEAELAFTRELNRDWAAHEECIQKVMTEREIKK